MLVPITPDRFDVVLDIRYATEMNFTGRPVYARPDAWLIPAAAEKLAAATALARPLGLKIKLFDAYRPPEVQWALWAHTPDPEFLADPRKGSPHSRGAAVDITLVDRATGNDLDMGTGFDAFTPASWHGSVSVSTDAQRNRLILLGLMSAAGWDFYAKEWWHYQLFDARRLPLLSDTLLALSLRPR